MIGGRGRGLVYGPVIAVWCAIRLFRYLRSNLALLREPSRDIRPDEFAPMENLRLRMASMTVVYLACIVFAVAWFMAEISEMTTA